MQTPPSAACCAGVLWQGGVPQEHLTILRAQGHSAARVVAGCGLWRSVDLRAWQPCWLQGHLRRRGQALQHWHRPHHPAPGAPHRRADQRAGLLLRWRSGAGGQGRRGVGGARAAALMQPQGPEICSCVYMSAAATQQPCPVTCRSWSAGTASPPPPPSTRHPPPPLRCLTTSCCSRQGGHRPGGRLRPPERMMGLLDPALRRHPTAGEPPPPPP